MNDQPSIQQIRDEHAARLAALQFEERRAIVQREIAWRERLAELATVEAATARALRIAIVEAADAGLSNREIASAIDKSFEWVRQFVARERRLARGEDA